MPELEQITLTAGDKSVAMPVLHPTLGQPCIDIAKLPKETGCFTYDPGFGATASCKSAITYIDGDAGVLLYRGYPIEQLAEKSSFTEVAYLLMHGELPTQVELGKFEHEVTHHTMMHEAFRTFLYGFRHDAHPMAMLTGMLGSLASFYHNDLDLEDPEQRRLAAIRLIAKVPTIAAACTPATTGSTPALRKSSTNGDSAIFRQASIESRHDRSVRNISVTITRADDAFSCTSSNRARTTASRSASPERPCRASANAAANRSLLRVMIASTRPDLESKL